MIRQTNWGIRLLTLFFLLLTSCQPNTSARAAAPSQPENQATSYWEEGDCPFQVKRSDKVTCGTLTVPEDRSNPDSPLIDLAVAIFHATNKRARPDPILYLEGGPGGSALISPDFWIDSPLRKARDLIVFDQRGTGYSQPALTCPPAEEVPGKALDSYQAEVETAKSCHAFWEAEGINLAAYNSAESASDVADLRVALGIERWNLYGISYGTRLALTVLRDHPEGVRSVVIDSVYPPNIDAYSEQPQNNADAILLLLDECKRDKACKKAFPQVEEHLYELIDRLNESPFEEDDSSWTGDDFVAFLVSSLYDTEVIPSLPRIIEAAYYEDYTPWLELESAATDEEKREPRQDEVSDDAQGTFWSVECYEEAPFGDPVKAAKAVQDYPPELSESLLADVENFYKICKIWQVGSAPNLEDQAVSSATPTLLFTGQLDPITPPSWAKLAAKSLRNHFLFEAPRAGHGITANWECPQQMMIDFLNRPTQKPDGDCLEEGRLDFETE